MKTVYFKSSSAEWKYELDDEEYEYVLGNVLAEDLNEEEMLQDCLEIIRDVSNTPEEELGEDDEVDQTISVAFIWHYFNALPEDKGRIEGDVALIEEQDGSGVGVLPAKDVIIEE